MAPVGTSSSSPSSSPSSRSAAARDDERGPRITVLRALGLGDLLTAVPALRALRRAFPRHRIELAAPAVLGPLAALTGAVDETVDCGPLAPLPERLHRAEVAVNLHGRGPQSHALLRATRPRRMIAFADTPWASGPRWRRDEHEVLRWCRLLAAHGITADPHDLRLTPPSVPGRPCPPGAVVVHPGAASAARRWPAKRFATVARALAVSGRHVVVTGNAEEAALARCVAAAAGLPGERAIAGATDLVTLAAVLADADCLIAGDTGVAHLATAVGTRSVLLFGPTSPDLWGPFPERRRSSPQHRVLWSGTTGDPHADTPDPGLLRISPNEVLRAVDELLTTPR